MKPIAAILKKLLPLIILFLITSCNSNKNTKYSKDDEQFELCSKDKYDTLITNYGPDQEHLAAAKNVHSLFENLLIREKHLTEISKPAYASLLEKAKRKEIKTEFFEKFKQEIGFEPILLFRINMHLSCYEEPTLLLKTLDESSWQFKFIEAYWKFEAKGDLSQDQNLLTEAMYVIPDEKFEMIMYRKIFLDLIYTNLSLN